MSRESRRPNFNRRMDSGVAPDTLERWRRLVRYGGNPEHKRLPGDVGLQSPASPRPDKSLCDEVEITRREEALGLLREGLRRRLVNTAGAGDFPKLVWAVKGDRPLEAHIENQATGTYHGYPLPETDLFAKKVLRRWTESS